MSSSGVRRALVISGPSGGGKSTLLNRLFDAHPNGFSFTVSHTTRSPRSGEKDGTHYHFVSRERMAADIAANKFLEHAEFGGNLYGTSQAAVEEVMASGKIPVLDVDIAGVRALKASSIPSVFVFVQPPSVEALEKRLRARNTETEESLAKRLARAKLDLEAVGAEPALFDATIVNDDLGEAYAALTSFLAPDLAAIAKE